MSNTFDGVVEYSCLGKIVYFRSIMLEVRARIVLFLLNAIDLQVIGLWIRITSLLSQTLRNLVRMRNTVVSSRTEMMTYTLVHPSLPSVIP